MSDLPDRELRPTMRLRFLVKGSHRSLQQEHQVWVRGYENDGFDGGQSWPAMVPSSETEWVNVESVIEFAEID
ncbi:hypothetical protein [Rosistilla oblonga]|uniref:Uncharacterized protein n=1 Tax=Rosistilla oblonga TaxID=2527990 RepID=A0A518IQ02_9BACT|nr:hypothetical protein [Rosistilla oblonga]QDV55157.1 hypothetical protein Mal33_11260 [Rosistilla oblonga]